jgi:nucleotide-binding universal stress UspA family protein
VGQDRADEEAIMFTKMLIPLDGSRTAEKVLPYARSLAGALKLPVELVGVIDIAEMAAHVSATNSRFLDNIVEEGARSSEEYLKSIAKSFSSPNVKCAVERGKPEEAIIDRAAVDKGTLITMATHGRSGLNRWLLGSVAEKVLRGSANPLLLVRAPEEADSKGVANLKTVLVPLDGSELAETVLPTVMELSKALRLEILLFRAFHIPANTYAGFENYSAADFEPIRSSVKDEALEYLARKVKELKSQGAEKVTHIVSEGFGAEEINVLGRKTPDNLIAMCTHGRSGVKRWVLGSVTEKVVRHSGDPVLVLRSV